MEVTAEIPVTEEEAARKPPDNVERPETDWVPVMVVSPALKAPATVLDAEEINPPDKVERSVTDNLPEVIRLPEKVPNPADNPDNVEVPVTDKVEPRAVPPPTLKVEEADNPPETFKELEIVEEAVETNPFDNVAREEKLASPVTFRTLAKVEEAEEINPERKLDNPPKKELLETMICVAEAVPETAR